MLLATLYIILILTVSRSAWLGAGFITFLFLFIILTNLKFHPKNWQLKEFLKILRNLAYAIIGSILIIYIFHLTDFKLFERAQSTGGLQKITISCKKIDGNPATNGGIYYDLVQCPEIIENIEELRYCDCRFINLEEIDIEKAKGNEIKEIYRKDPNINIRQQIYQKSWEQIKNSPILGIGWGSIGQVLGADERGASLNSSNIFLEVWLGSGIVGFLAFIAIWIYILISAALNFLNGNKAYGIFLILGIFAILIPNLFNAGIMLGFLWVFWGISQAKKA